MDRSPSSPPNTQWCFPWVRLKKCKQNSTIRAKYSLGVNDRSLQLQSFVTSANLGDENDRVDGLDIALAKVVPGFGSRMHILHYSKLPMAIGDDIEFSCFHRCTLILQNLALREARPDRRCRTHHRPRRSLHRLRFFPSSHVHE